MGIRRYHMGNVYVWLTAVVRVIVPRSKRSDLAGTYFTLCKSYIYVDNLFCGFFMQISEAICAPEYRRLDQPEFCPKDYYAFMLRCWHHDEHLRPTFTELWEILPEVFSARLEEALELTFLMQMQLQSKPEQLQAIRDNMDLDKPKCRLQYTIGDVIVVLDNK